MQKLRQAFVEGHAKFPWTHCTITGDPMPVEVSLERLEIRGECYVASYVYELREIRRLEEALRKRNEDLRHSNSLLRVVNNAAEMLLLGEDNDEIGGMAYRMLGGPGHGGQGGQGLCLGQSGRRGRPSLLRPAL